MSGACTADCILVYAHAGPCRPWSHNCQKCGHGLYKGYPFTVCDDCWPSTEDRIQGALLALSRVMVWVWMEGSAKSLSLLVKNVPVDYERYVLLMYALDRGLLRLTWSEP